MPAVATFATMSAGIDGPSTPIICASPNVVAGGLAIARLGDPVLPHKRYGAKTPHGRVVMMGSSSVVVNGLAVAYQGSTISCGDIVGPCPIQTVQVGP